MKKYVVFLVIWVPLFALVVVSLSWHSNSLYEDFDQKEVACNNLSQNGDGSFSGSCMIENILMLDESKRSTIQQDVVIAFKAFDKFNVILLLGTAFAFVFSGIVAWFVAFRLLRGHA